MKALLLSFLIAQLDLSKVTKEDIIATVEHLQRNNVALMDKLDTAQKERAALAMELAELKAVKKEIDDDAKQAKQAAEAVQVEFDIVRKERDEITIQNAENKWLKWKWRIIAGAELALFASYFLARNWLKTTFPFLAPFL